MSPMYHKQIADARDWFKIEMATLPVFVPSEAEYVNGIDRLNEPYAALTKRAFDEFLNNRNYELSYNQLSLAFFAAADELGKLALKTTEEESKMTQDELPLGALDTALYGQQRTTQALLFAVQKHNGVMRKYYKDRPYIMHPIRVAEQVRLRYGNGLTPEHRRICDDSVCAAFLHDVVEDCGVTVNEIKVLFGQYVATLVWELTNPSKGSKLPRAERKKMDREHIAKISSTAKFINLVDRIDNMSEIENADDDFKFMYAEESLKLLEVLRGTSEALEGVLDEKCRTILAANGGGIK